MKNKKSLIIIIISIVIIAIIAGITIGILRDENKLTIVERNWISNNTNNILSINVLNDGNIFGKTGNGVFFDFLDDFSKEYNLEVNPIAIKNGENPNGVTLRQTNNLTVDDVIFYTDHYVLVGKDAQNITRNQLSNKNIGIIADNLPYVSTYLKDIGDINYTQFSSRDELINSFSSDDGVSYILVPLVEYLDSILENDYKIVYHFSDINTYYTLKTVENDIFSNILRKYYSNWNDKFDDYFKDAEFTLFVEKLSISSTEVDKLRSVTYNYGFVNNSPYEVIIGGNYGGIVAVYLSEFRSFADVEFNFTKYRNYKKFVTAINKGEIDLYYNYYNLDDGYNKVDNGEIINFSIIANKNNNILVKSLNSLNNKTVYVQENSLIESYLTTLGNVDIKTYANIKDVKKLLKKDAIIAIDTNVYNYYAKEELKNGSIRYSIDLNNEYAFKVKENNAFYKLLSKYINTLDKEAITIEGIYNHEQTMKNGTILSKIAQYFLYFFIAAFIVVYLVYRSTKKIKVSKKIKKEDKMKFIDQLTSLKNRNYLSENIHLWNNNKVYPQTILVIDLNNIQYINDTLGYEEGDRQITAVANILIKTQLDNSDIIRTDGNEFLVYLIGYSQKQITSYIHKLNKEFKNLPYEYGAEFGYSMITDDIKTIEDAMNEAVEEMKKQKNTAKEG